MQSEVVARKQYCYALTTSLNDSFYRALAWDARLLSKAVYAFWRPGRYPVAARCKSYQRATHLLPSRIYG